MVPWIFVNQPLEWWMADYQRLFDAWEDGGIRGIVVGRLVFQQEDGTSIPTFRSDPKVYASYGVTPPPETPRDMEKEKQLQEMLDNAASRGWHIMIFVSHPAAGALPIEQDPYSAVRHGACVQDLMNAYPQVHGHIIDGPGEHGYELAFHHGGELFELDEQRRRRYPHLGVDVERFERGMNHLRDRFHQLTPTLVRYHAPGGMLGSLTLFDLNDDALYWLRTRQEISLGSMAAIREQMDKLNRKVELGGIPRTAAFSSLTGQNYEQMGRYFDYVFPKHYFWHRGFDGMYGTIARWVKRIGRWNPTLTEQDGFAVVKALFGIDLPEVQSLPDMEHGFPDAFFSKIVFSETRRALQAVGDAERVIAWVSTGREPHGGDPMPTRNLELILQASEEAGLKKFLFHSATEMGAAEWRVISGKCGNLWNEDPNGYWPANTSKPDTWNGERKPSRSD